ncbi:MAG: hypothetical protein KKF33_06960 [Alphaproteobacteria bacterium]|nr:hypothetical protein [Alphaproteobacteria bacterium]
MQLRLLAPIVLLFFTGSAFSFERGAGQHLDDTQHPEIRGLLQSSPLEIREIFRTTNAKRSILLDRDRSLLVTDARLLAGIKFRDVMEALAARAGQSAESLFRDWWRTLGAGSDSEVSAGIACPSGMDQLQLSPFALNKNFEMQCDEGLAALVARPEGADSPIDHFIVVAALNRGDLSKLDRASQAANTSDCGEYRLVAALDPYWRRHGGPKNIVQLYIILEASIHSRSLDFCVAIQQFWANLSTAEVQKASADLSHFFLKDGWLSHDGVLDDVSDPGDFQWRRALSVEHLGAGEAPGNGQVRTNTFVSPPDHGSLSARWTLREFEFVQRNDVARLEPASLASSPQEGVTSLVSQANSVLADAIRSQQLELNAATFSRLGFTVSSDLNANQQTTGPVALPFPYVFGGNAADAIGEIANKPLTEMDMKNRITVMSCGGCHRFSNNQRLGFTDVPVMAASNDFTHLEVICNADPCDTWSVNVSTALRKIFLPQREEIMRAVLGAAPIGHQKQ